MKSLCITGPLQSHLDIIAGMFKQFGLGDELAPRHNASVNLKVWHERVLANYGDTYEALPATISPGKLWEQLAGDIFLANIEQTCWGWANIDSCRLLDFWLNYDPGIQFVLVCVSPENMLAEHIQHGHEDIDSELILETWKTVHEEMLRFHLRHAERSVLVDAEACCLSPNALIALCCQRWRLPLSQDETLPTFAHTPNPVATFLASHICAGHEVYADLQHEIQASLSILSSSEDDIGIKDFQHSPQLIQSFRHLWAQAQLADQQSQLAQQRQASLEQLTTERDQQSKFAAEQQQQIEQLQRALNEEKHRAGQQSAELQQENELLLMQLHQVQEELETVFLKQLDSDKQIDQLTKLRDEQAHLAQQCQVRLEQVTAERDQQVKALAERQQQIDQLTAERQQQIEQLQRALNEEKHRAGQQSAELQQENELLLLQLHQVQEELEHYFLQYQESQNALQANHARWQRMLKRQPGYIDYESIHCSVIEGSSPDDLQWQIQQLKAAGRDFDVLKFGTLVENGVANLYFEHDQDCPLLRWPNIAKDNMRLLLTASGDAEQLKHCAQLIKAFSISDWRLLNTLPSIVLDGFEHRVVQVASETVIDNELYIAAFRRLVDILSQIPNLPRFDGVTLKREQVNPDYEHLWLEVSNLSVGGTCYPTIEFRLSCANVRPKRFGSHPKLELPVSCQSIFESWYDESQDDFGDKLELRFATSPHAMDVNVWRQLSSQDQIIIKAILVLLPQCLESLQQSGQKISRNFEAWIEMAEKMHEILLELG